VDGFVAGDLPMFMLGWFPDFVDPDNWLTPFASCLQSPDNGVNYCNPDMDKLLQSAASATDPTERTSLYKQIGELYADDVPTIPLFWEPEFITYRNGVQGIAIGGAFEFNYNVLSFADGYKTASGDPDTIIIGTTDEVNSLDAGDAYSTHDWEIIKNTGMALMSYTPGTTDLVPGAAVAAPTISDDGLTYTYTLKDGLAFADGTPLTSQDYVYAWDRLNTLEGQVSGLVQVYVKSVEAPDAKTVVYHLKQAMVSSLLCRRLAPSCRLIRMNSQRTRSINSPRNSMVSAAIRWYPMFQASKWFWKPMKNTKATMLLRSRKSSSSTSLIQPQWQMPLKRAKLMLLGAHSVL
jgi:peptide/nickel transport system substrate-binding protein